jgi:maltose O-acetyltransferase
MKELIRKIVRQFNKPPPPLTRQQRTDKQIAELRASGMTIGDNVGLVNVTLDSLFPFLIEIGSNVLITHATILAHDASPVVFGEETRVGKVKIGDCVFIGAGAVVLPGVEIGTRCIVGANAVVSRNVPAGSVVAGNPGRVVAKVDDWLIRKRVNGELVSWSGGIVPSDADVEVARRLVARKFEQSPHQLQ